MSTEYYDLYESSNLRSNCCDATIYAESDICTQCGEHCDVIDVEAEEEKLRKEELKNKTENIIL